MSRSVYLGYARHGEGDSLAEVVHRIEVLDDSHRANLADTIAALCQAEAVLTADGIDPDAIRFGLEYDREPDYGDDRILPKLVVSGRRPATEQEVEQERERQAQAHRQRKADEVARLRAALAAAEGRR